MSSVNKPENINKLSLDTSKLPNDNTKIVSEKTSIISLSKRNNDGLTLEKENKLKFTHPKNAPQNAYDFTDALIKNKERLMQELSMDSETYNLLAQAAVAIANTETEFGTSLQDKAHKLIRSLYKWYDQNLGMKPRANYSMGITNLKYTLHVNDKSSPEIKDYMYKFGIYFEDQLNDTETSAIATIILLNTFNKRINRSFYEGFEQSKENFGVTRIDALCALWNGGRSAALKHGNFNPQDWWYTIKAHKTLQEYKIVSE